MNSFQMILFSLINMALSCTNFSCFKYINDGLPINGCLVERQWQEQCKVAIIETLMGCSSGWYTRGLGGTVQRLYC